jgi:hypothetical protein
MACGRRPTCCRSAASGAHALSNGCCFDARRWQPVAQVAVNDWRDGRTGYASWLRANVSRTATILFPLHSQRIWTCVAELFEQRFQLAWSQCRFVGRSADDVELICSQLALEGIAVKIGLHVAGCLEVVVMNARRSGRFITRTTHPPGKPKTVSHGEATVGAKYAHRTTVHLYVTPISRGYPEASPTPVESGMAPFVAILRRPSNEIVIANSAHSSFGASA